MGYSPTIGFIYVYILYFSKYIYFLGSQNLWLFLLQSLEQNTLSSKIKKNFVYKIPYALSTGPNRINIKFIMFYIGWLATLCCIKFICRKSEMITYYSVFLKL